MLVAGAVDAAAVGVVDEAAAVRLRPRARLRRH
jgi:hypothetical protein